MNKYKLTKKVRVSDPAIWYGEIIGGVIGGIALATLGIISHRDALDKGVCGEANPSALWAAFDKDGNLVDAVRDIDGNLINPKTIMVFGNKIEK